RTCVSCSCSDAALLTAHCVDDRPRCARAHPSIVYKTMPERTRPLWPESNIQFYVTAVDESSKIDLNYASDALLRSLMTSVGGLDDQAASHVVDAILDWRDPDDAKRPNGAEADDYRAAGLKYGPSNAPVETVGEL